VIRLIADSGVMSLLEWDLDRWAAFYGAGRAGRSHRHNGQLAFLRFAYTRLEDLAAGAGWESEFDRDVWALHRLGFSGTRGKLRFDKIPQPWLRALAKRFVRWRLTSGREIIQARVDILALNRFAAFLARVLPGADGLECIDRGLLERFLAELARDDRAVTSRGRDVSSLNAFFAAIRRHAWAEDLPASAAFYPEDFPRPAKRLPRALADHVMAQLDQPENLGKWASPDSRLLTQVLMRCGLRVGDACNLALDCVIRDGDGAPYLRYLNRKMKREALVPLDEEVHAAIIDQQRRVRERFPGGSSWLFPAPKMNPDGAKPLTTHSYRGQLDGWLERCNIRDEHGQPVRLTPHQWRHTFGTTLINRDVPQEVVRVLLDHTSAEMTAHYARLHDTTVRRHWENARKVNVNGDTITVDPAGPLAEASWAKQRIGRATQSLPNGFCGLPVQKSCPHANACLTCPMFVTTAEFLPQHREQRRQTVQLLTAAEARGQTRLIEMNRTVLGNLDRIITSLDSPEPAEETG
jgi:integrase